MPEFQHTRTYPMKRRVWPIVVGVIVALMILGCAVAAYVVTTGGN